MINEILTDKKLVDLKNFIRNYPNAIVAFSGGVDATFVLKNTIDVLGNENVLAVIGDSQSLPTYEKQNAIKIAEELPSQYLIIETNELDDKNYFSNPVNRCYFCKSELFTNLVKIKNEKKFSVIFDGTNFDDLKKIRYGKIAGNENHIVSPLAECKLSKEEVRFFSKKMDLKIWNKPSSPCLSSRIPFGEEVTKEKLLQIEEAEKFLQQFDLGSFRVRHHNIIARIEVEKEFFSKLIEENIREKIVQKFKSIGFAYVTFDLNGFASGHFHMINNVRN